MDELRLTVGGVELCVKRTLGGDIEISSENGLFRIAKPPSEGWGISPEDYIDEVERHVLGCLRFVGELGVLADA